MSAAYVERLQRHLRRFWPDHRYEPLMWTLGSWPHEHVACYSEREDHDGLHDGHTVPIGQPWVEGAAADHLYVNKPYFISRDFAGLKIDDSFSVQFLWLVPITEREKEWRHECGQEAFEQWLEDHEVRPEDPARRSSV